MVIAKTASRIVVFKAAKMGESAPPSIYAVSLLDYPKALPVDFLDDDIA